MRPRAEIQADLKAARALVLDLQSELREADLAPPVCLTCGFKDLMAADGTHSRVWCPYCDFSGC